MRRCKKYRKNDTKTISCLSTIVDARKSDGASFKRFSFPRSDVCELSNITGRPAASIRGSAGCGPVLRIRRAGNLRQGESDDGVKRTHIGGSGGGGRKFRKAVQVDQFAPGSAIRSQGGGAYNKVANGAATMEAARGWLRAGGGRDFRGCTGVRLTLACSAAP